MGLQRKKESGVERFGGIDNSVDDALLRDPKRAD